MDIVETAWEWAGNTENRTSTGYIIFHHAAADCTAADIHRWHQSRGWIGIGYHYFVDKSGQIWRGRPEITVGAHCIGKNYNSIGVCFEGNFETDVMQYVQIKAGAELTEYIKARYPGISTAKHCDFDATDCPGRNFPFDMINGASKAVTRFGDIKGHWAEEYVNACADEGILEGWGDGLFHPDEYLTRAELAAALVKFRKTGCKRIEKGTC